MKKQYLKYIPIFIVLFITLISNKSFAITSSEGGYAIENYDIYMIVNENNTFDITEKITVNFYNAKHRNF